MPRVYGNSPGRPVDSVPGWRSSGVYTGSTARPETEVKSASVRVGSLAAWARHAATSARSRASSRSCSAKRRAVSASRSAFHRVIVARLDSGFEAHDGPARRRENRPAVTGGQARNALRSVALLETLQHLGGHLVGAGGARRDIVQPLLDPLAGPGLLPHPAARRAVDDLPGPVEQSAAATLV